MANGNETNLKILLACLTWQWNKVLSGFDTYSYLELQ